LLGQCAAHRSCGRGGHLACPMSHRETSGRPCCRPWREIPGSFPDAGRCGRYVRIIPGNGGGLASFVTISRGPSGNPVHRAEDCGGDRRSLLYRGGIAAFHQARTLLKAYAALHTVAPGDGAGQRGLRDPRRSGASGAGTRRAAAWILVALLIAVFPANVYMALHPVEVGAASIARCCGGGGFRSRRC
jgi:hypothetical protein